MAKQDKAKIEKAMATVGNLLLQERQCQAVVNQNQMAIQRLQPQINEAILEYQKVKNAV